MFELLKMVIKKTKGKGLNLSAPGRHLSKQVNINVCTQLRITVG